MTDSVSTATPVDELTVLYDAGCSLCQRFREWLAGQATYVPVSLVPAGSPVARHRFPGLDHDRTLAEITVVGSRGELWTHEQAWVMCLWVTVGHRPLAERLATPAGLPLARAAAHAAARIRQSLTAPPTPGQPHTMPGGDYPDPCAGSCAPVPEG